MISGKMVLAAVAVAVISFVIHSIESILTMSYYLMPELFALWSKVMMPGQGAPGTEFFVLSIFFAFIGGLLYAFVFNSIKAGIPGHNETMKGLNYGLILFLVAGLPSTFSMYLLLNIPTELLSAWAVSGFIVYLLSGIIIAKILK
ncbi:MAG: hypothetical protein V1494_03220 [Candidatus Diapherotrites archaeon]